MCVDLRHGKPSGEDSLFQRYLTRFASGGKAYSALPIDDCDVPISYSVAAAGTDSACRSNGCARDRSGVNVRASASRALDSASDDNARLDHRDPARVSHRFDRDSCDADSEWRRRDNGCSGREPICSDFQHRHLTDAVVDTNHALSSICAKRRHRASSSSASETLLNTEEPGGRVHCVIIQMVNR